MTVGTSIFLSALIISAAILFSVTKDRWNWKRLSRWVILLPTALIAFVVAVGYVYTAIKDRPKPQTQFFDISLRATPADVKFAKGEPTSKDGEDRWIYNVSNPQMPADAQPAQYLIQFKDGRVRFILYTAEKSQLDKPYLMDFTLGSSFNQINDKLGTPSYTSTSSDDLSRLLSYNKYNVFFTFEQAEVVAYGIFDSQGEPVKFKEEKP